MFFYVFTFTIFLYTRSKIDNDIDIGKRAKGMTNMNVYLFCASLDFNLMHKRGTLDSS